MPDPKIVEADEEEPGNRPSTPMPEGGASSLAQRDASGEVDENDLSVGQRRRSGKDVKA